LLLLTFLSFAMAQDVPTYHNDNARTGQDLNEITLTPKNVNSSSFGRLFTISVEGKVDAQPLYAAGVAIPGQGTHNVLVVATEHDSVYAFDADTGALIWKVSMLRAGETPSDSRGCSQVEPEIDITSTPVIDRTRGPNGAIYLVAMSKDGSGNYFQRLHALDLATHAELLGGPKDIQAKYPGTGDNSDGTNVIFDARQYKERPGLLLLNGVCIRRGVPLRHHALYRLGDGIRRRDSDADRRPERGSKRQRRRNLDVGRRSRRGWIGEHLPAGWQRRFWHDPECRRVSGQWQLWRRVSEGVHFDRTGDHGLLRNGQ
jgi:hypothetical protein